MEKTFSTNILSKERKLPVCSISEELAIAFYNSYDDDELMEECARFLLEKLEFDTVVTMASKGIPIAMAVGWVARKELNRKIHWFPAVKEEKIFMINPRWASVKSITTTQEQGLILDGRYEEFIAGKNVLLLDDVISTGASIDALGDVVAQFNPKSMQKAAILAEGDAAEREDIFFIQSIPLIQLKED
jgi:adenine phosphoribosyltransferase